MESCEKKHIRKRRMRQEIGKQSPQLSEMIEQLSILQEDVSHDYQAAVKH